MSRGTVWSNVSTYGSVGALGGQPPRATRLSPISRVSSDGREGERSIRVRVSGQSSPAKPRFRRDDHVARPFAAISTPFPPGADSPGTTIAAADRPANSSTAAHPPSHRDAASAIDSTSANLPHARPVQRARHFARRKPGPSASARRLRSERICTSPGINARNRPSCDANANVGHASSSAAT